MKTKGIQLATQKLGKVLLKNSPTILTGLSVAGLVTTVIFAVKVTPKALQLLEDERDYREYCADSELTTPITKVEAVQLLWRCYLPALGMGAFTIGCIISANSINLRRNAALASVYSLTEATLKEYQAKVIETIGEKKEHAIKDEVAKDKIKEHPVSGKEVYLTGKGDTLCYDVISGRYFKNDIENIRRVQNDLNQDFLNGEMFITLNDLYYSLGLSNTKLGDDMGWDVEGGMINIIFSSQLTENGTPCLVLDYKVSPRYEGDPLW